MAILVPHESTPNLMGFLPKLWEYNTTPGRGGGVGGWQWGSNFEKIRLSWQNHNIDIYYICVCMYLVNFNCTQLHIYKLDIWQYYKATTFF